MYDIAPLIWSFDRHFYPTQPMHVQVEDKGGSTFGMTTRGWGQPNAQVSTDMREDEVKRLYLETLGVGR